MARLPDFPYETHAVNRSRSFIELVRAERGVRIKASGITRKLSREALSAIEEAFNSRYNIRADYHVGGLPYEFENI